MQGCHYYKEQNMDVLLLAKQYFIFLTTEVRFCC